MQTYEPTTCTASLLIRHINWSSWVSRVETRGQVFGELAGAPLGLTLAQVSKFQRDQCYQILPTYSQKYTLTYDLFQCSIKLHFWIDNFE
ncbi:hypothetical protein I7I50_07968 [Histoplasma capsulatum G186AR]|uniref:Uncharacterized protein n=1 Tax=Ajellomyces capsulatus TaxID=5037 RepID=A0A8H7YKP3_AJECA|nr:hypothetical protein I7I52_08484 [Histoplasma capsulatum]QSS68526.1 hypothetical protein I7I50_07968 [Histoplasma capsulatum G186AR]